MSDTLVDTGADAGSAESGFWVWVVVGAGAALAAAIPIGSLLHLPMPF